MTSVMGSIDEQQETIQCVNRKSDSDRECDACGGALLGLGCVKDY